MYTCKGCIWKVPSGAKGNEMCAANPPSAFPMIGGVALDGKTPVFDIVSVRPNVSDNSMGCAQFESKAAS